VFFVQNAPERRLKKKLGLKMFDVGRVCVKIAGRDARKSCAVVEVIDDNYVLIDGQTRRRKCSLAHLEPTKKTIDIKKGASNKTVAKALSDIGIECQEKVEKPKDKPKKEEKSK